MLNDFIHNQVVISAMLAWIIGQGLKLPIDHFLNKRWNWGIIFSSGGMPSSHSSLMTSVTLTIACRKASVRPYSRFQQRLP
jgi:acid phosphatase family membrane protein YuiD